jgi:hypothetical protein
MIAFEGRVSIQMGVSKMLGGITCLITCNLSLFKQAYPSVVKTCSNEEFCRRVQKRILIQIETLEFLN